MSKQEKIAFVTVGSTRFDALVTRVLSEEVVEVLKENGVTTLIVQAGNSTFDHSSSFEQDDEVLRGQIHGLSVEVWTYKPSLKEDYERAALVIGHAGIYLVICSCYVLVLIFIQVQGQYWRCYDSGEEWLQCPTRRCFITIKQNLQRHLIYKDT
jgi:UDP-N-acetylglucosamine transferase subunit ALG13